MFLPTIRPVYQSFAVCILALVTLKTATAESPLPDDPKLAKWTLMVESVMDETVQLQRLSATNFNVPGAKRPSLEEILALWKKVETTLPPGDQLRARTASFAAKLVEPLDKSAAAEIAKSTNYPMWAAQLFEAAGKPGAIKEAQEKAVNYDETLKELKEKFKPTIIDGQYRDYEIPPASPIEWIDFLTSGPDDPWLRQCDGGFGHFVRGLPDNARLHRAVLMYYTPCVSCGLSPVEGEIDKTEPLLRLTAEIAPEHLARVYSQESPGHGGWAEFQQYRITGDSGVTGNALWLIRDLLVNSPDVKKSRKELLTVVRESIAANDEQKIPSPRWRALAAWLDDGAPDPRMNPSETLSRKLLGTALERRWALAWIPNMLTERGPAPKFVDADLGRAIATASSRCVTGEDRFLACVALASVDPADGIDAVIENASHKNGDVLQASVFALMSQYRVARKKLFDEETGRFSGVPPEFVDRLPKLRTAFYERARIYNHAQDLMNMFADLGDTELDAELAKIIKGLDDDSVNIVGRIAVCASLHPDLDWPKTLAALKAAGARTDLEKSDWVARLAGDLESR